MLFFRSLLGQIAPRQCTASPDYLDYVYCHNAALFGTWYHSYLYRTKVTYVFGVIATVDILPRTGQAETEDCGRAVGFTGFMLNVSPGKESKWLW